MLSMSPFGANRIGRRRCALTGDILEIGARMRLGLRLGSVLDPSRSSLGAAWDQSGIRLESVLGASRGSVRALTGLFNPTRESIAVDGDGGRSICALVSRAGHSSA